MTEYECVTMDCPGKTNGGKYCQKCKDKRAEIIRNKPKVIHKRLSVWSKKREDRACEKCGKVIPMTAQQSFCRGCGLKYSKVRI